jgi:tetratricopeptide (TPR) repeat protein
VIQRYRLLFIFLILAGHMPVSTAETDQTQKLDSAFQTALSQYNSGQYQQAAEQLEELARQLPQSFDVHELLGMVYAAESQEAKANNHLAKAVQLKPDSVEARTNLATNLVHLGNVATAENEFRKAVELDPGSYGTNHNLGEIYIAAGKLTDAVPYLEKAQKINSAAYDNGYDLALAYAKTGKLDNGRSLVQYLLKQKDTAELHNVLGEIEEKDGKFVAAESQYEIAAHMDPSESNLFDWGSELLVHRTLDPAVNVFQSAAEHYPNSPRLAIGLGMALYSRGNYDDAVKALLKAADLNPSDPRCYYFLSKAYDSSPSQADAVIQRFRRFVELQPHNARAHYYYAMSLWKGRRAQDANLDIQKIESLLKRSIMLDPNLPDAHLQLGNLYSDQAKYADAIPQYQRALEENADLADAHYRMGQAYVHTGQKARAQDQLEIYQRLRAQHLAELDKQRAEIRQFVYSEKDTAQH